jgi:hypothetical protein
VIDEVKQVDARGGRMREEELGDGPGVAGQEFAVGASVHAVMGLSNGLAAGESLLA